MTSTNADAASRSRRDEQLARRSPDIQSGDPIGVQSRHERLRDRAILEAMRDHFDRNTPAPKGTPITPRKRTSMASMRRWWESLTEAQREEIRATVGRGEESPS